MPDKLYFTQVQPHLAEVKEWVAEGYTHPAIAAKLGISASSFRDYRVDYAELAEAVADGFKERPAKIKAMALDSLVKRVQGFYATDTETVTQTDEDGNVIKTTTKDKSHYIVPDTTAIIFALKNLSPEMFYDRQGSPEVDKLRAERERKQIELVEQQTLALKEQRESGAQGTIIVQELDINEEKKISDRDRLKAMRAANRTERAIDRLKTSQAKQKDKHANEEKELKKQLAATNRKLENLQKGTD